MIAQLDTKILSSFLLYLDHEIQAKGQAFQNVTSRFYPSLSPISGTYVYTSPYKPLCNDVSISGANVLSGVYLGNQYVQVGQSGLSAINHYKGALYFTGQSVPANIPISGNTAIKEINIKITDKQDWKLLFETQYVYNNTNPVSSTTGLPLDTEVSPIVFIRYKGQENKPFGFSKLDNQTMYIRTVVVADTEFQKMGLTSIMKNMNYRTIPLVVSTPFDSLGNMTGINYNYSTLSIDTSLTPMILGVKAIDVPQQGDYRDIVRNMAIVDFELSTVARS
jgi:hypothetical protein